MRHFYINGRFLTQHLTGVQRFGREVLVAMDNILSAEDSSEEWTVLVPTSPKASIPSLSKILVRQVAGWGHVWDQSALPWAARKGALLNLCNSGPLARGRQVVVIHDAAVFRYPSDFSLTYRTAHRFLTRNVARRAKIFTVSEFSRSELSDVLRMDPMLIGVTPNGSEHALDPGRAWTERTAFLKGRPFFLLVGRPTPRKNHGVVYEALRQMGEEEVLVAAAGQGAGGDTEVSAVLRLASLSDQDLGALYANATALIFPSLYEGFGIPLIEAAKAGCLILASDIPPSREVCGSSALYFKADDPASVASAMTRALHMDGAERDALVQAARERLDRFSWGATAQSLLDACRAIAA